MRSDTGTQSKNGSVLPGGRTLRPHCLGGPGEQGLSAYGPGDDD